MTKKRQMDLVNAKNSDDKKLKSKKVESMSFDEVKAIILQNDSKKLREIIAEKNLDINMKARGGRENLITVACKAGFIECVQVLLDYNITIHADEHSDPLDAASSRGHVDIVKLLLNLNKEGRIAKERLKNALISATGAGYLVVVQLLVSYGVDSDSLNAGLYVAAEANQLEVAAFFLDHKADANAASDDLYSAITIACNEGHHDILRLLLSRGADPNGVDGDGISPLCVALYNPKLLTVLFEYGADPNLRFADESTALLDVVQSEDGNVEILSTLLENHANPNLAVIDTGDTALFLAALDNNMGYVKVLLEHGADVTQANHKGKTVLTLPSRTRKYAEIIELCTQYIDCNKPGAKLLLK